MKKTTVAYRVLSIAVAILLLCSISSCSKEEQKVVTTTSEAKNGPIADKVIYTVSMDQSLALKDVVAGNVDLFFNAVPANILSTLSDDDMAKLDTYKVPSGSWSLMVNPCPDKAPYTIKSTADGSVVFNPFAIKEVRFALNWLIDRKKIVDEILLGDGMPSFTSTTEGQPGTYRYNLIASKLGMKAEGDERKAIADITAAMEKAAALPENKGKLVKSGNFWKFNGNDVTIKFLIRVDDPTGRLPMGRYVSDQIEKAGIKVERIERDRSCINIAYDTNPQDFQWHLYTEGWGAGATRAWWDVTLSQMYAPYYGYMAGGAVPTNWNYKNDEIDRLCQLGYNGQYLTEKEYWDGNLKAMEMGTLDAARLFIAIQLDTFVANKERFNSRMAYGLGDGMNGWSIRTADVKPNADGQKVLRVVQFSARGTLFMGQWDPVGADGFSDTFSGAISDPVSDPSTFESPNNAADTPLLCSYNEADAKVAPKLNADGTMGGTVEVPADCVMYDSKAKKWVQIGAGKTAAGGGKAIIVPGYKWHNGEPVTQIDSIYATAFAFEWCHKDGDDDKYYDATYSSSYSSMLDPYVGVRFNKDGSIEGYQNFYFAPDMNRTISTNVAPIVKAGNYGRQTYVSWEIYEALALLVAEGSASGTVWSFTDEDATNEVDIIASACVADIKAKLEDMKAKKHIPASLAGYITAEDAIKRYDASLAFINKYGHAYVGNGPYYISIVDTDTNSITLEANRDYPYKSDYWPNYFKQEITAINNVKAPASVTKTQDASFEISASSHFYPEVAASPLSDKATVKVCLQLPDGSEKVYAAKFAEKGLFKATIPAADIATLNAGSYTVVIISSLAAEAPSVATVDILVQ